MLELERVGEVRPLVAAVRQTRRTNMSRSAAELTQEALNQMLAPPRVQMGEPSLTAARIAEINSLNRAKTIQEIIHEALGQTLKPPRKLGEASLTAAQIAEINSLNRAKTVRELVQEVLGQTLSPSAQLGGSSLTAAQISQMNRLHRAKTVDELIQEALNQTLAIPGVGVARLSANINQSVPTLQKMAESVAALKVRMEALKTSIRDMSQGHPINDYLSELRDEVMADIHVIDAIVKETEFEGNKPLSKEGSPMRMPLADGSYMEVPAEDLSLEVTDEDLGTRQAIEAVQSRLEEKLDKLDRLQKRLLSQSSQLEAEVKRVELKLIRDLGFDPNEINADLAAEIAVLASSEALSWTMKGAPDARQVRNLLKDPMQ